MAALAELAFLGGGVHTVDAAAPRVQAVAVREGRIVATGSDDDVRELCGPRTQVVDLAGRLLMPGFQDAHVHASAGGLDRMRVDLSESHTRDDYARIVTAYAATHPGVPWILGAGWSLDLFDGGIATREQLDALVSDRPAYLVNRDHHGAWANSRALELAGITRDTPDPADGRIERDAHGEPVGTLQEGAMNLVERVLPPASPADRLAGILVAQAYLHSLGITAWQEAIVGDYPGMPDCFDSYLAAASGGTLTGRVVTALWFERGRGLGQLDRLLERRARAAEEPSGRVRANTVKIMYDGVCENFTAAMLEPYRTEGLGGADRGLTYFDADELKGFVARLDAEGFQVHFHAIGDRGVRDVLDAVEAAGRGEDNRHHVAHLQVVHPDDLARFGTLGVTANAQMLWAQLDGQMTDLTMPFLGPERASGQYPFEGLRAAGARLAGGSDWPISTPDPIQQIHVGVNRTAPPGYAFGDDGAEKPFLPEQRLTLDAALEAFTAGSAFVNHLDDTGVIRVGNLADLVVLDRDPFAHPPEEIGETRVLMTFVDGRPVHEAPGIRRTSPP
jgi:predicted amidohydrolase YtcJ